jgi:tRNA A37 threonylcarbamoyladenosine modification protein TsaB
MYSLFLDTTQKHCHLAILKNDNFIKTRSVPVNNNLTDIVVEHINQLLNECEIDKKNIGCLYFLNGPGSFTGIRVATLIAKT